MTDDKKEYGKFLIAIATAYLFLGVSVWVNMVPDWGKYLFIAVSIFIGIVLMVYALSIIKKH